MEATSDNTGYPFVAPSSTSVSEDLLFFDTFSHSSSDKNNFDLVQFPSPVVIDLIKIIPLGQPVEAKIPGNVRLGATNPSNCELEFFINDLTKQDAHTMTDIGKFLCTEKNTDFCPPSQIQTDGLLLKGSYRTLTLAIFGQIATYDDKVEGDLPIISAASPPAQTPASPVASERDMPYMVETGEHELTRDAQDESESFDESTMKSTEYAKNGLGLDNVEMIGDDPLEPSEILNELTHQEALEDLSSNDGEQSNSFMTHDKKITNEDTATNFSNGFELDNNDATNSSQPHTGKNFSLTKQNRSDTCDHDDNTKADIDYIEDEDSREWRFKIDTYRPESLTYFTDPSLTIQERGLASLKSKPDQEEKAELEIGKVKEMFEVLNCDDENKSDDWVTLIEDLTNDIANMSLGQTISDETMLKFLVDQACCGLDINLALRQKQVGFRVRHLRAGLKLISILSHCGPSAVNFLLQASVPHKVLSLYHQNQIALPLRLLILKCLNAICDNVECVEHFVSQKYEWNEDNSPLNDIKNRLNEKKECKLEPPDEQPDSKQIEIKTEITVKEESQEESKDTIKHESDDFSSAKNEASSSSSADQNDSDTNFDFTSIDLRALTCYQYLVLIIISNPRTRVTIAIGNLMRKIRLYQNYSMLSAILLDGKHVSETGDDDSNDANSLSCNEIKKASQLIQDILNLTRDNAKSISQPIRYLPAYKLFQRPQHVDTHLAIYKWMKHHRTLGCLKIILNSPRPDSIEQSSSASDVELWIRLQNLGLVMMKQITDSPKALHFLLNENCIEITGDLLQLLLEKRTTEPSHMSRVTESVQTYPSGSFADEAAMVTRCRDLGLRLAYNYKVFSSIDKLFQSHRDLLSKRTDGPLAEPEQVLHQLFIISDHPYGLAALLKHFSTIGNLDCLLRFLDMPENPKQLEFVKETSIDYVIELVGTILRLNDNVLDISYEYSETLLELCRNKDKNLSVRIKSWLPWLNPFDSEQHLPEVLYSEETFRQLMRVVRKSIPNYSIPFVKGLDYELPPQLITAVRILRQLCVPPQVESFVESNLDINSASRLGLESKESPSFLNLDDNSHQHNILQSWNLHMSLTNVLTSVDEQHCEQVGQVNNLSKLYHPYDNEMCGDLRYHYGIIHVFEQEGLKRLLNTLRELIGNYPHPTFQSAALSGIRGRIVLSHIHSVIVLVHSIICHLIDARGSEFKDASAIPVMLETYSLLCFVQKPGTKVSAPAVCSEESDEISQSSLVNDLQSFSDSINLDTESYAMAQKTKKLILSILLSYTQMCLSVSESEEKVISKSMWTRMLKEVIDFTLSTPLSFCHGIDVFTKILPPPFPSTSVMDSIDQEVLFKNINHRKLWSAHLHPLHQQLELVISNQSISCQSSISKLLCYLCNQLCDLSSNAACMVARIITDTLINHASKLIQTNGSAGEVNNSPSQNQSQSQLGHQQMVMQNEERLLGGVSHHTQSTSMFCSKDTSSSSYSVRMIVNLLCKIITNQAFETAFTNQLQVLSRKDEKLLNSLQNTLKLYDDLKLNDHIVEDSSTNSANLNPVNSFIASLKAMSCNKDQELFVPNPPENLTRINLLEIARKTTDRFSLQAGLTKTYRLKVLLDMNSRTPTHRLNEPTPTSSSVSSMKRFDSRGAPLVSSGGVYSYPASSSLGPSSHKGYGGPPPPPPAHPPRSRGRNSSRADAFRNRPQNTSRPPSIHVDDFMDLYGDSGVAGSSSSRHSSSRRSNYRLAGHE